MTNLSPAAQTVLDAYWRLIPVKLESPPPCAL